MLRIKKDTSGCVTTLRLSGRIQSDQIASIRSEMDGDCASKILDLSEVTLVCLGVVQFWMLRERAEEAQPDSSDTD
jgi:hypothetical protein